MGRYFLLVLCTIVIVFPFWYALSTALSPTEALNRGPRYWPADPTFSAFADAFNAAPLGRFLLNTVVVSFGIVAGQMIAAVLAAYAFAFLSFPAKRLFFVLFLATMMIPAEATIIPNYLTMRSWGWLDSYAGLVVVPLTSGIGFGTFLMRQFFLQLPLELYEAARVDGASSLRFLLRIALPLSRSGAAIFAVYAFLNAWNQYLWPLLVTSSESMRTVQIGLAMLQWADTTWWNLLMAGVVVILLPTLAVLFLSQKQLAKGVIAGAIRG
ncbi:MAG: carbohydrate ABC transporter permease [Firmicutes bacterium]|nr:carbohydrate ABC transporter permease [Bacillota bacterium]